jgi:hypothetical protein
MVKIIKRDILQETSGSINILKQIVRRNKTSGIEIVEYYLTDRDNGYLLKVTPSTDLAQNAVVNDNSTFTNPTADRDWDISTASSNSSPTGTVKRTYDFGSVQPMYIYFHISTNYHTIDYSTDGTTWNNIYVIGSTIVTIQDVKYLTLRYLRFSSNHTSAGSLNIYELIACSDNVNTRINDFAVNNWFKHVIPNNTSEKYLIIFEPLTGSTLTYSLNKSDLRESIKDVDVI